MRAIPAKCDGATIPLVSGKRRQAFTGGNEFFAVAVAAFEHAVNARLPPTHAVQDEAKLLGQFASLKAELRPTDIGSKAGAQAGNSVPNPLDARTKEPWVRRYRDERRRLIPLGN
jgi:hypothetical protein